MPVTKNQVQGQTFGVSVKVPLGTPADRSPASCPGCAFWLMCIPGGSKCLVPWVVATHVDLD